MTQGDAPPIRRNCAETNHAATRHRPVFGRAIGGLTWKAAARSVLANIGKRLPAGARRALLQGFATQADAYECFQAIGSKFGVKGICVSGEFGLIEGDLDDRVMISAYAQTKTWSPAKNAFLVEFFAARGGGSYIDVGANIGLTTIPVARNPKVDCKAFEPEGSSFRYLMRNVERNCPNGSVEFFNCALFDERTTLRFELSALNLADHRVHIRDGAGRFDEHQRKVITVPAHHLDDVVNVHSLRPPVAAKVVAQGAEAHVIAGGRSVFAAAEAMVVQLYPYAFARTEGDLDFFTNFLAEHFRSGAVIVGDRGETPIWKPMDPLIEEVRSFMQRFRAAPYDYRHLLLRK